MTEPSVTAKAPGTEGRPPSGAALPSGAELPQGATLSLAKDVLHGKPLPPLPPDQTAAVEEHLRDFLTRRGQVKELRNFAAARAEEGNPISSKALALHEDVILGQWRGVEPMPSPVVWQERDYIQAEANARAALTGGELSPMHVTGIVEQPPVVVGKRSPWHYASWEGYIKGLPLDAPARYVNSEEQKLRREEAITEAQKLLARGSATSGGAVFGSPELFLFPNDVVAAAQARNAAEEQKHTTPEALARRAALVRWGTEHPDDPFPFEFTKEEGEEAAKTLEAIRDGIMVAPFAILDAQELETSISYGARIEVELAHQVGIGRTFTTLEWGICFLAGGMTEALAPALVRVLGISIGAARAVSLFAIFEGLSRARQAKGAATRGAAHLQASGKEGDEELRAFAAWRESLWNLLFSLPSSTAVAVVGMVMNIATEVFVDQIAAAVYEGFPRLAGWAAEQAKRIARAVVKLRLQNVRAAVSVQQAH